MSHSEYTLGFLHALQWVALTFAQVHDDLMEGAGEPYPTVEELAGRIHRDLRENDTYKETKFDFLSASGWKEKDEDR